MKGLKMFTIEGKVWRYQGESPWHFVYVNETLSRQIRDTAKARKNGLVRIKATLGKSMWSTALFPTKDGPYLLCIKAQVRHAVGITDGDRVRVTCSLV